MTNLVALDARVEDLDVEGDIDVGTRCRAFAIQVWEERLVGKNVINVLEEQRIQLKRDDVREALKDLVFFDYEEYFDDMGDNVLEEIENWQGRVILIIGKRSSVTTMPAVWIRVAPVMVEAQFAWTLVDEGHEPKTLEFFDE